MTDDILKVELISQWWQDLLPIVAIIISVATFAWSMWDKRRDRARLKAVGTTFALVDPGPFGSWFLAVEVTNVGHVGTTVVHSVALELPQGGLLHSPSPPVPTVSLPKKLEPGESMNWAFRLDLVAQELRNRNIAPDQLKAFVNSGHGNVRGKMTPYAKDLLQRELDKLAVGEPDEQLDQSR